VDLLDRMRQRAALRRALRAFFDARGFDELETPLLIVQGDLDLITLQSDEVFVALRRLGKEVVYAKYAGEDHWEGTWSAANAVDYWERVIGWFDAHLSTAGVKKQQ